MATRKPTFKTGFPAIATPRQDDLRLFQQAFDAVRERFGNLEAQVTFLAQVADASSSGDTITTIQTSVAKVSQALNVLSAQFSAFGDLSPMIDRLLLTPKPTQAPVQAGDLVSLGLNAAGQVINVDRAQLAMFIQANTRQPIVPPPADSQAILASRIFGG